MKEHPLNAHLYNEPNKEEQSELVKSIKENGLLEVIRCNLDHVVLSGHRRLLAIKELGWETIPVILREYTNEEKALIEYNRYRRKTISEIMREADKLLAILRVEAGDSMAFKTGKTGRISKTIAKSLGIGSGVQYDKLKKVWEAAKENPHIAQKVIDIDNGKTSIHAVFKQLRPKGKEDISGRGLDLQIYNFWYFLQPDPGLGIPHPGQIAGQVIQNLMWYYSQPGDLIVDPFCGGGSTIDACQIMDRECLGYDIAPVRDDIEQWDISEGYPPEVKDAGPQLVFADPPYWNMLNEKYLKLSPNTASNLSMTGFTEFLFKLAVDTYEVLRPGGFFALIIMPQTYNLPEGTPWMDWPFEARIAMDEAGFVPYRRIINRWPASLWNAHQVEQAKDSKHLLQVTGDIIVGRKP